MRTTVTLDPDVEAIVRRHMQQRGVSFKQALNDTIRSGAHPSRSPQERITRPRNMGVPHVDLSHALRIAADLEDAEATRRMQAGR